MINKNITILSLLVLLSNINPTQTMGLWNKVNSNKNVKKYVIGAGTLATAGVICWKLWKHYNSHISNNKPDNAKKHAKDFDDEEKNNAEADGNITHDSVLADAVDKSIRSNTEEEKTREELERNTQAAIEESKRSMLESNSKILSNIMELYFKQKNEVNDKILDNLKSQEQEAYKQKIANKVAEIKQRMTIKKQKQREIEQNKEDKELFEGDDLLLQSLQEEIIPIISHPSYSKYQKLIDNYQTWKDKLIKLKKTFDQDKETEISLRKLNDLLEKLESAYSKGPWIDGRIILNKICNDETIQGDYLKNVVQLFWYAYSLCAAKKYSFERGTIRLEDKQGKIFNYIKNCPGVYDRSGKIKSSHFHELNDLAKFGLDIPRELRTSLCFQNDKFHILFGQLQSGTMFIKPEDRGINNFNDIMEHSYNLIGSMHRRFIAKGSNDQIGVQCEHVPHNISLIWKDILSKFNLSDKKYIDAEKHGIYKMIELLNSDIFKQNLNKEQQDIIIKFSEVLEEENYDNKSIRKGREAILAEKELVQDFGSETIEIYL